MAQSVESLRRYVDPAVAEVLLQSNQQSQLGVAEAEVTVFFSDIADFTSMAEVLQPEQLIDLLGTYLDEMAKVIAESCGVVGEFIGDGIMAWWNVPVDLGENHTLVALRAALKQQQQVEKLNASFAEKALPQIRVRMGLACGKVLAGNVGTQARMKYGLVGDVVNLASRLEGLCKIYGVNILVDGSICKAAGVADELLLRPVDSINVKGRSAKTDIFQVVSRRAKCSSCSLQGAGAEVSANESFCKEFTKIYDTYRAGDFAMALRMLARFQMVWPGDRPAELLWERCFRGQSS
eukprot:TRINITY_DN39365_c0_g1_i1.p1 TRINITY_DN39365_c0_g1~~TRINITY_DN39365_c0_g1_i1.p1  ORF type:complete len:293 (+),score=71.00 TRINITY_DN39365_c0_g1_i1:833-1711(+)